MGITGAAFTWTWRQLGRNCKGLEIVYQRDFLDIAHRRAVAGFATGLRELEECSAAFLPLA